jgi:hypothetical protein
MWLDADAASDPLGGYRARRGLPLSHSPNILERLSEKGYDQRSEREFGWYTEGEMDRKAPLWRPAGLRCKRLRGFSDSLRREILRSLCALRMKTEEAVTNSRLPESELLD